MASDPIYCEHDRLEDACEDCAFDRAVKAGLTVGGPKPAERLTEAVTRTQEPAKSDKRSRVARPRT